MSVYVDYIVTCFVCGCIAAWIAKTRGRNPLVWFFVGAIFNVLVLIMIGYLGKRQSVRQSTED